MPDFAAMTPTETRDLVIVVTLLLLVLVLVLRKGGSVIPPAVAPVTMPIEEQMREARHRVANLEQRTMLLDEHAVRLRSVEAEIGAIRTMMASFDGKLNALKDGHTRIERSLDMLVEYQVGKEGR